MYCKKRLPNKNIPVKMFRTYIIFHGFSISHYWVVEKQFINAQTSIIFFHHSISLNVPLYSLGSRCQFPSSWPLELHLVIPSLKSLSLNYNLFSGYAGALRLLCLLIVLICKTGFRRNYSHILVTETTMCR